MGLRLFGWVRWITILVRRSRHSRTYDCEPWGLGGVSMNEIAETPVAEADVEDREAAEFRRAWEGSRSTHEKLDHPWSLQDISHRKRLEAAAADCLRFEKLLADLSATFVNLPSERLDGQIDSSLKMLVRFLGNDRSTLDQLGNDKKHVLVTHSYAAPGCEPFPLGLLADDRLPWFIGQFRSGNAVFLRRLPEDLPPEAEYRKALL